MLDTKQKLSPKFEHAVPFFWPLTLVAEMGEEERSYETEVQLRILGYLMGQGSNDNKPKVTVVENFVDVKIPRERVILGDINTFLDEDEEGKGFYRE